MPTSRIRPWVLIVGVIGLIVVGAIAAVALTMAGTEAEPGPAVAVSAEALEIEPAIRPSRTGGLAILRAWDVRRAQAWALGDVGAVADLYTDDAEAGDADQAMLRRWVDRGLVVESLQTQVRGATVVTRSPRRLVIVVTDRIVGGYAVRGQRKRALPADRWSTRRITLRQVGGRWLVAGVAQG